MSKIFGQNIDFNYNETFKFRVENQLSFPNLTTAEKGNIFFHTANEKFYGWTGTSWLDFSATGGGGGVDLSNYVTLNGAETITGSKLFQGTLSTQNTYRNSSNSRNTAIGQGSNFNLQSSLGSGMDFRVNGDSVDSLFINPNGSIKLRNLSGTGSRMVVADTTGLLSTQAIPSGGVWGSITGTLSNQTDLQTVLNTTIKINAINTTSSGVVTRIGRSTAEEIFLRPAASELALFGGTGVDRVELRVQNGAVRGLGVTTAGINGNSDAFITKAYADATYSGGAAPTQGTFTPVVTAAGGGITYNGTFTGDYMKVGKLVYFTITISSMNSTGTSGGTFQITNLPFAIEKFGSATIGLFTGMTNNPFYSITSDISTGAGSQIRFNIQTTLDGSLSQLASATFSGATITVSGTYIATT